jgi:LysM repeat protein
MVKVGEWGNEWYRGTFRDIRQAYLDHGIGCAPFYFNRPQSWQADAVVCARVANIAGNVILDCEEPFLHASAQLSGLVNTIRQQTNAVIVVTGYGDPNTVFGDPSTRPWDFGAIANADAYQPQLYFGYWGYTDVVGRLVWGINQCGSDFVAHGLGLDFPIMPCINVQGVRAGDLRTAADFLKNWKAGIGVWENLDLTAEDYAELRTGLGPKADNPPLPAPPSVVVTYTVQSGDNLSSIAKKYPNTTWKSIYDLNRPPLTNPDRIYPGQVLRIYP